MAGRVRRTRGTSSSTPCNSTSPRSCRIYGVPPEMIAADIRRQPHLRQRRATGPVDLLTYTVGPWLGRIETALTDLVARGTYVKFNAGALLRTDLKTRYE